VCAVDVPSAAILPTWLTGGQGDIWGHLRCQAYPNETPGRPPGNRKPEIFLLTICSSFFCKSNFQVLEHARGVRPVSHARVRGLVSDFLEIKRESGSEIERRFYTDQSFSEGQFIIRCLTHRPLVFWNPSDSFQLASGRDGASGFEMIGTDQQRPPLVLHELISYDEMPLSSLLGVSVPTCFVNSGGRHNMARPGPPGTFEEEGVIVGLVGARLEKAHVMEWQHMVVSIDIRMMVDRG
jgi:hypothetical protein